MMTTPADRIVRLDEIRAARASQRLAANHFMGALDLDAPANTDGHDLPMPPEEVIERHDRHEAKWWGALALLAMALSTVLVGGLGLFVGGEVLSAILMWNWLP